MTNGILKFFAQYPLLVFFMVAILLFILSLYNSDSITKNHLVQVGLGLLGVGIIIQVFWGMFGFSYRYSVIMR